MAAIGLKVAAARKALGLSQKEMAERLDVSQGFVSRLEGGEKLPSLETLLSVSKILGVQPSEFLDEDLTGANDPLEAIRTGTNPPVGLRELAVDDTLISALKIQPEEWRALSSIKLPTPVTKDGYVQLLITIRAVSAG